MSSEQQAPLSFDDFVKAFEENALGERNKKKLHDFVNKLRHPTFDAYVKQLEEKTELERVKLFYIVLAAVVIYLLIGGLSRILCNMIGFLYPCYESIKAIRANHKKENREWLTYWTVFAVFSVIDTIAEPILQIFPVYYLVKALFLVFLVLPQTKATDYLYHNVVDPTVAEFETSYRNHGNQRSTTRVAPSESPVSGV